MLVLSRRLGEVLTIHMPQGIVRVVVFQAFDGEGARIGIHAPQEIRILKSELKGKPITFKRKVDSQESH